MKAIVACDVDGVVADLLTEWLRRYNEEWADSLDPSDITEWDLSKLVAPACGKKVFRYLDAPDLYEHVEPIPGSLEGVEQLRECGYRVVFATSCLAPDLSGGGGAFDRKVRWLERYGLLEHARDAIATYDKTLVAADLLIDDAAHNVDAWLRHKKKPAILFDAPHNQNGSLAFRAQSWTEVVRGARWLLEYKQP